MPTLCQICRKMLILELAVLNTNKESILKEFSLYKTSHISSCLSLKIVRQWLDGFEFMKAQYFFKTFGPSVDSSGAQSQVGNMYIFLNV